MANLTVFTVKSLTPEDYKIVAGLYNDFKNRAVSDFKFDLEPLEYEDFLIAVKKKLLECLVLFENSIPTGILIYTNVISYSVELNLIYLISMDNYETRIRYIMNEFLKKEEKNIKEKTITYPLLGEQEIYKDILATEFGFGCVPQLILKFDFSNPSNITKIGNTSSLKIFDEYEIDNWNETYKNQVIKLIYDNFKNTNDALFDTRFKTYSGSKEIVNKIISSGYGQFLPEYTKIIIKNKKAAGVCFVNVTGNGLVNIPLVAVAGEDRNKKLGEKMVSLAVKGVLEDTINGITNYSEVNVTTDSSNYAAIKMYEYCGFKSDYKYLQCYKN